MSKYIADDTKLKIKKMIEKIESKSDAEVAVVVADSCDRYRYSIFLYAFLATLIVPFLIKLSSVYFDRNETFALMMATFLFVTITLDNSELKYKIAPKKVKNDRCEKVSEFQFYKLGVNKTKNHKAILIFISIKERYIRVVADKNIDEKVSKEFWKELVKEFIKNVKNNKIDNALINILDKCGKVLVDNFPRTTQIQENEILNDVVEI